MDKFLMQEAVEGVAVIFVSKRADRHEADYQAAAERMAAVAAQCPGYLGMWSAREPNGVGLTVSFWRDEAAASAWKAHPEHAVIRERGRADWYEWYDLAVARVVRSYNWQNGAERSEQILRIPP